LNKSIIFESVLMLLSEISPCLSKLQYTTFQSWRVFLRHIVENCYTTNCVYSRFCSRPSVHLGQVERELTRRRTLMLKRDV